MNNTLLINYLKKGISYTAYRALIKELLIQKKATGTEQTDAFLGYSMLNDKRMDRLDKTLKLAAEAKKSISKLTKPFTFLVISEGWCGDAAQILPAIHKIAEASNKIDFKIILRDENEELMNLFLTNGSKSIPKVIIMDSENKLVNSWGPRPAIATKMVLDYKEKNGSLDADFKKDLQIWYNKDKGNSTQKEIVKLLKKS